MSDEFEPHHWADRILFSIWRDLFPIDELAMNRRYRGVDLFARYHSWFVGCGVMCCMFRAMMIFALGCGLFLYLIAEPPTDSSQMVVLRDANPLWIIPILGTGIIVGGYLADAICRLLLRSRYREFCDYSQWKCGFDGRKAWMSVLVVIVPVSLGTALILHNHYWEVGAGILRVHTPWSVHEYAYSDVRGIVQDDLQRNPISGETRLKLRSTAIIHFKDGQQTRLATNWYVDNRAFQQRWLEWLSKSTRVPITRVTRHTEFQPPTETQVAAAH
jgi:hypothetical protein